MTDAVDEARAALERELYKYLPTDTCAQDRKDIRAAADRLALEYVNTLASQAFLCHELMRMPTPAELEPPHTARCAGCIVDALRARLEGGSHDG